MIEIDLPMTVFRNKYRLDFMLLQKGVYGRGLTLSQDKRLSNHPFTCH
jgi:hypothetical protein